MREKEYPYLYSFFLKFLSKYRRIIYILMIKYNKKHISYNCAKQLISIFNLCKWKEVLLYLNIMAINL